MSKKNSSYLANVINLREKKIDLRKSVFFDIIKADKKVVVILKYSKYFVTSTKKIIYTKESKEKYKNKKNYFTRDRKMPFDKVVLYGLNKKGITSKMEIEDFTDLINSVDVSYPAVLKQRLKLNGKIYLDIMQTNLVDFYEKFTEDVKLFHGYILTAIDGSDFEIPNTKKTREEFNEYHEEELVARATISNMFDVLNHYVMDTIIEKFDYSERKMAYEHFETIKKLGLKYPIIRTGDRGYSGIVDIYYSLKSDDKFVYRLKKSDFKKYIQNMKTNDEIITIPYQYDRVRYYKEECPEFYKIMEETKEDIKVRIVKINDKDGEEIVLVTNLEEDKFDYNTMIELYKLRWEIEISYHLLKESLKIETITSSFKTIIEQDIYSQMLAFNIISAFANDAQKEIDQTKYKNEMKINMNMAIGFVKKTLILIIIEEDRNKQDEMFELLMKKIPKYIVPVKKDRHYPRNKNKKNKYSINKRKSF